MAQLAANRVTHVPAADLLTTTWEVRRETSTEAKANDPVRFSESARKFSEKENVEDRASRA